MSRKPAEKLKYGGGMVVGNLAYDYDYEERRTPRRAERERQEEVRPERRTERQAAAAPQARPQPKKRARERQRVSFVSLLGFTAIAAMVVVIVMSYAQLTTISADVVSMQKELSLLQDENVSLLTQYERTFDLSTIKEAAAAAGMYKPSTSQINYIDLSAPDSIEIYKAENTSMLSRVFTSFGQGVGSVVEYFR